VPPALPNTSPSQLNAALLTPTGTGHELNNGVYTNFFAESLQQSKLSLKMGGRGRENLFAQSGRFANWPLTAKATQTEVASSDDASG